MSALREEQRLAKDINLVFDLTEKPNRSQLKAHKDRAVVAKLRADLVLPTDKILTVDIDFDSDSGYHNTSMLVMNDFGVEMLATAFEVKYGKEHADKIRKSWDEKQDKNDPRKPTYMLVQEPTVSESMPIVMGSCGSKSHPTKIAPKSIV
ncbi:MAG: hypothetical protein MJK12_19470 [Colwellia sp.]|nr:hypothetical protein [Colwellia sp.]